MLDESARLALAGTPFADVRWFDEVASTNQVAADLVRAGARPAAGAAPVVIAADHQTAGRGRLGRRWVAPPGSSLLASIVWLPASLSEVHLLTGAVALAAVAACREVAGVEARLKWPNDLVAGDGKLGGILGEIVQRGGDVGVVVGLGLNVTWQPPATPPPPGVALNQLVGHPVDRVAVLLALLRHLGGLWRSLASPDGAARLADEYRARSATIGRWVRVDLFAGAVEGQALDVTPEGHLVVQDTDGRTRVVAAGDVVHVRPAD
jgi:BirA family biotin operon repressor/biotin-[acetyl-CoA-carboxylase] ligase